MNGVWNQVQSSLRARLGTQDYEIWIMPIRAEAIGEHAIQLQVPNRYYQQWVQLNYGATLCQELNELIAQLVQGDRAGIDLRAQTLR